MPPYRFGLRIPETRSWIEARWREYGSEDRDGFVRNTLLQPGQHILPLFEGSPEVVAELRQRHLERLVQVFGESNIVDCLRKELDPILDEIPKSKERE